MTTPKQRMGASALDWRDFVTGLGSGDDATAIAKAFGKVQENTPTLNPGLDITLRSTLALSNRAGLRLMSGCEPRPNGGGASPVFRWAGPDGGGPMILLDQCLFPELSGFMVELDSHDGTGPAANRGIVLDGFSGPSTPGQPYYGFGTQGLIERVVLLQNWDNPDVVALDISPTSVQNHEYYDIRKCQFSGGNPKPAGKRAATLRALARTRPLSGAALRHAIRSGDVAHTPRVGIGLRVGASANAKAECVNGSDFSRWAVAIMQQGGSMHIGGGECAYFTDNEIDYLRTGASEASFIRANSEASRQFLVDRSGYGMTILAGTRLHNGWQRPGIDNAYIVAGQLLHFEGASVFDSRPPTDGMVFDLRNCTCLTGGPIHFAAGTTFSETGLGTMPLTPDRYMDVILYNVVDDETGLSFPRRYIRGNILQDCAAEGREATRVRATATSGIPDFEAVRTEIAQSGDGVGAGGQYAALGMTFTKTKGGAPSDVRAVRSNVP